MTSKILSKNIKIFLLLLLFLISLLGCGKVDSINSSAELEMESKISTLKEMIETKEKEIDSLEESLCKAETRIRFLEKELECYKDFAEFSMDIIDEEILKEYALTLWDYSLFIRKNPLDNWEPFPLHGEAEIASSEFQILLKEEQAPYPVLPVEIFNSGRISEIGEYGHFFEHLEIISSFPYELQGAAGTVVDTAIYEFKDVPKGTEIEITVTPELQERIGLETAKLRVKIK